MDLDLGKTSSQPLDEARGALVGVGAGAGYTDPFRSEGRCLDTLWSLAGALQESAGRAGPVIAMAGDRDPDRTQRRCAVLDERDVDGELAVSLQELLRSVQGVDQPVPPPVPPDVVGGGGRLLGEDRELWGERVQRRDDRPVRGEVRVGQR